MIPFEVLLNNSFTYKKVSYFPFFQFIVIDEV